MLVVKTTSPATSPSPAKLQPRKAAPSSRTRVARLRPWFDSSLGSTLRACSKPRSRPVVYRLSTNYSTHDPARQPAAQVRGVGGTADQGPPLHHPLFGEVNEREVGRRPDGQAPPLPDPPPRGTAHRLDEPRQGEPAAQHQLGVERGEGRLVPEKARRGLLHRQLLLLGGVRRVVGRHEVKDAALQALLDAATVAVGAQRRGPAVEAFE